MRLYKNWKIYIIVFGIFIFWATFTVGINFIARNTGVLFTPEFMTRHAINGFVQYELGNYLKASKEYEIHYQIYNKMLHNRQKMWIAKKNKHENNKNNTQIEIESNKNKSPEMLGNLAWYYYSEGSFKEAKKLALTALEIDPSNDNALFTLSRLFFDENNFEDVLSLTNQLLERNQDHTDVLILQSAVYSKQNQYNKAIDSLNRGLRDYKGSFETESFITALKTVGELMSLPEEKRPNCLLAHYHRYLRIFDISQGKIAIKYAQKAIEKNDRPDEAYMTIGLVNYKIGNYEAALENLFKAISLNHNNSRALDRISTIYADRNDLLNEYHATQNLAKSTPDDPFYTVWHVRFLRNKLGDYQQALTVVENTLRSHPDDPQLLHQAGLTYYEMGNYTQALEFEQKAVKYDPNTFYIHEAIGRIAEVEGRYTEAYNAYDTALKLAPFSSEVHLDLERVYEAQKRYKDAIKEYKVAFELGEDNIYYITSFCQLYYKISEYQYAVDCFKDVLKRDPENNAAKGLLSQSLQNINRQTSK
ncbi:MAG: tetratricopeptide repeat protein [Nitrospirae bacterium]|nr:tetratricopeptide repeat protein [Nitrospirota bacterium]MBI3351311.1 tetratricopeptide repeat protein [Nitrospirota bacterium]